MNNSARSAAFQDLDDLLLGPTDLEAMPFEFGCDFASAFDDKQLDGDARGAVLATPVARPKEAKRSHKRKSDSTASTPPRPLPVLTPPASLDGDRDEISSQDASGGSSSTTQIGRWTKKEHELFLEGLRLYGKSWKKISSLVVTRTLVQIRTHAQKYLQKQTKSALKAAAAKSRKPAPHSHDEAWKNHHPHPSNHHENVFLPIAFPGHTLSSSSQSSSSFSSSSSSSSFPLRKDPSSYASSTMSKLDQLLHDDSHHSTSGGSDDFYTSPTGTDDELVQWLQHRHLPYTSSGSPAASKRRRTDVGESPWSIVNPTEALSSYPSHFNSTDSNQPIHTATSSGVDFLATTATYSSSAASNDGENDFIFGSSWM